MAAERWPTDGVPPNPVAWLVLTARRRAIDRIRRERRFAERASRLIDAEIPAVDELDDSPIADERLELIFTCCHPALALEAQVALTLRALGGLRTEEIARLFLVSEETMKRRLSRARSKITLSGIPFAIPDAHALPDRLTAVLAVVYLIFTEGWDEQRGALALEAVRLGRVLIELMPDESEAQGLLALMLIHHARRRARFAGGRLVLLGEQDRSLWDIELIAEGRAVLERAIALRGRGPYVLQAAIASLQVEPEVDWREVSLLYGQLAELTRSPVVELNRAVALAEAGETEAALQVVDELGGLGEYRYLPAVRAELLRRLGRPDEARDAYQRAIALAGSEAERQFLMDRHREI